MAANPNSTTPHLQVHANVHPVEAQIVAAQQNLAIRSSLNPVSAAAAESLDLELQRLRLDLNALRSEYDGCVSALPGQVCEHCASVIAVRLRMIVERDRRNRKPSL